MDLLRVEEQRQALEQNLQKLRQSLRYWQTFEAEYEGLKEEIQTAEPTVDVSKLTEISQTYDGEFVNEVVVRELAGLDKPENSPRTGNQIVRDIERRQEYVQKNIDTIQKRFFECEAKLEEFDFAARDSGAGLPLTEIHEELDDDGNVISSRLEQPEVQQTKLLETLKKAGLTEDDLGVDDNGRPKERLKPAITNASPPITPGLTPTAKKEAAITDDVVAMSSAGALDDVGPERPPIRKKSVSFTADTKAAKEIVRLESEDGKKTVSFAEKVAIAPAAPPPDTRTVQFSPQVEEIPSQPLGPPSPDVKAHDAPKPDSDVQKELRASFKPGDKVAMINDDDEIAEEHIVLPEDESPEDAQIRREMLDYHLNEVGHIVAEMDLDNFDDYNEDDEEDEDDDTSSHVTGSTHLDDEDTPYTSTLNSDEEEEDEYGRTKHKVVSDGYRQEMLEMQKRLIGNLGPAPDASDLVGADPDINPQDVRRLVIRDKRSSTSSASSDSSEKQKANGKKRVSFAQELDVAEPGSPPLKAQKHLEGENVAPVSDGIVERSTAGQQSVPGAETTSPAKVSKFKKTWATSSSDDAYEKPAPGPSAANFDTPQGPASRTLAEQLVERPTPAKSTQAPSLGLSDAVEERRQLAAEYYRRRNDMIQSQGGFKGAADDDEEMGELMEERDGKVKKVSRFKAARIKP